MAYALRNREIFRAEVDGKYYTFTCYTQSTSYGFRHICCEGYSNTTEARWIKRDIIGKACYYNRSYESFQYESVLRKGIRNVAPNKESEEKLMKILITDRIQKGHEECEAFCKAFEKTWSNLSETNKNHIKNGVGENGITSTEQANMVFGVARVMEVMQGVK